jgi:hypothetical protein
MKTVPLGGKKAAGRVALVDDEDHALVSQHNWHLHEVRRDSGRRTAGPYARTNVPLGVGRQSTVLMHVLILGVRTGIDHADGDGLNNTRSNLRAADRTLNNANRKPNLARNGTPVASRYKRVFWFKPGPGKGRARWRTVIRIDGRRRSLGYFHDEEDAARAYDAAAVAAWGEYARPNFPPG